jgi:hypothetical protein
MNVIRPIISKKVDFCRWISWLESFGIDAFNNQKGGILAFITYFRYPNNRFEELY